MRFNELEETAPPGMEQWIKDRKADFKERYGDRWKEVLYATAWKQKKNESVTEAGRRYTSYHDELGSRERDEQNYMDQSKRDFKRAEMQHELGHEDDPNFERNLRQQQIDKDRGPWYIRIDGVIYKQKGVAKSFDWKRGANNYALAILKNNPSLQGKIMLSKNAEDKAKESVTESAEQLEERRKAKKKHKVTVRNPDTGRNVKVDFGEPDDIIKRKKHKKH